MSDHLGEPHRHTVVESLERLRAKFEDPRDHDVIKKVVMHVTWLGGAVDRIADRLEREADDLERSRARGAGHVPPSTPAAALRQAADRLRRDGDADPPEF